MKKSVLLPALSALCIVATVTAAEKNEAQAPAPAAPAKQEAAAPAPAPAADAKKLAPAPAAADAKKDAPAAAPADQWAFVPDVVAEIGDKKITKACARCHSGNHGLMDSLYEEKILDPLMVWIKENGPLGILLHETRRIVQPAVWQLRGNAISAAYPVDLWAADEGWKRIWISSNKTGHRENVGRFTVTKKKERRRVF